jgi:hypothetical protein
VCSSHGVHVLLQTAEKLRSLWSPLLSSPRPLCVLREGSLFQRVDPRNLKLSSYKRRITVLRRSGTNSRLPRTTLEDRSFVLETLLDPVKEIISVGVTFKSPDQSTCSSADPDAASGKKNLKINALWPFKRSSQGYQLCMIALCSPRAQSLLP